MTHRTETPEDLLEATSHAAHHTLTEHIRPATVAHAVRQGGLQGALAYQTTLLTMLLIDLREVCGAETARFTCLAALDRIDAHEQQAQAAQQQAQQLITRLGAAP